MLSAAVLLLAGSAIAHPPLLRSRQTAAYTAPGVATFNDYAAQSGTVCGPMAGTGGTYGAAASDISPDIAGDKCSGTIDMSKCAGQVPISGYAGPSCGKGNCGTCYKVTNKGALGGGTTGGIGNSITVQIIDSCPSTHAQNYCKTDVPANQRCEAQGTNALDIDQSAYKALTGEDFASGGKPNLQIEIAPSSCDGGSSAGGGGSSAGASSATSSAPSASASSGSGQSGGQGGGQGGGSSTTTSGSSTTTPGSQTPSTNGTSGGGASTESSTGGSSSGGVSMIYEQCAGNLWKGATTCASGTTCQYQNPWYSQCLPGTGGSSGGGQSNNNNNNNNKPGPASSSSTGGSKSATSGTKCKPKKSKRSAMRDALLQRSREILKEYGAAAAEVAGF